MERINKKARHELLKDKINKYPFMTDKDLANNLNVSVQTVRLDRFELKIPEVRQRIKILAEEAEFKIKSISNDDIVGELIDIKLGQSGISMMTITDDMVFEKNKIAKGYFIYSQANSLAIAIIDAEIAITGVAKIKHMISVKKGENLVAKAEVTKVRGNKFFITVRTTSNEETVFIAKFIIVSLSDQ
ncbi:transcription factor FapR [Selenomonadales bacterium OttesenSCG-928-I06]|nr:transcription factor FapR [Selenomonadales bacterium OttesenSCG-928-I06]